LGHLKVTEMRGAQAWEIFDYACGARLAGTLRRQVRRNRNPSVYRKANVLHYRASEKRKTVGTSRIRERGTGFASASIGWMHGEKQEAFLRKYLQSAYGEDHVDRRPSVHGQITCVL
jgi:hypothetical protein